ncbi:hypothetical protein CDA63_12290 [Hymenobacter amundsenii]|uniref:Uncharacterized protein n=1 Tax=Hymenobacter amundsenii TaxID=2006685 RepID=A0A246FJS0_9BACT|nr:hypothetical protein [Hymenobacter amundsenii]OWP62824.1 hypothetical protein CDA63_12290 [Hymenobacter amundsenii]
MSNQKSNQPGEAAHKHVSFTPASEANSRAADTTDSRSQSADSDPAAKTSSSSSSSSSTTGRQPAAQEASGVVSTIEGLPEAAKSWINQQQWLQNVDVNQLSKQAKDLSTKAKEFGTKAVEQVNRLSTRQKVLGGAVLVTGLSWLALRSKSSAKGQPYRGSAGNFQDSDDDTWQRSSESVYRGATTRNNAGISQQQDTDSAY